MKTLSCYDLTILSSPLNVSCVPPHLAGDGRHQSKYHQTALHSSAMDRDTGSETATCHTDRPPETAAAHRTVAPPDGSEGAAGAQRTNRLRASSDDLNSHRENARHHRQGIRSTFTFRRMPWERRWQGGPRSDPPAAADRAQKSLRKVQSINSSSKR